MENGAEGALLPDGGNAQSSGSWSEGEAQDTAAGPTAAPSEDHRAMPDGKPPGDTQSFAHTRGDAQGIAAALPEMLGKYGGLAPHGMPPGDTQSSAHRSGSDTRDSWTAPRATPGEEGGVTPEGMRDTQSSAHQSDGATPDTVAGRPAIATEEGTAQHSAQRSGGHAQDAAPALAGIPSEKVGVVRAGNPPRDAQSSAGWWVCEPSQ
jgi:hypothetical protein